MEHTLQLAVPEEVYRSLLRSAEQSGRAPEAVAVDLLTAASQGPFDDPLEPFIGAFTSGVPDLADEHDRYLGEAILEHSKEPDEGKHDG